MLPGLLGCVGRHRSHNVIFFVFYFSCACALPCMSPLRVWGYVCAHEDAFLDCSLGCPISHGCDWPWLIGQFLSSACVLGAQPNMPPHPHICVVFVSCAVSVVCASSHTLHMCMVVCFRTRAPFFTPFLTRTGPSSFSNFWHRFLVSASWGGVAQCVTVALRA